MKNQIREYVVAPHLKLIKVQLDYKTFITLTKMSLLEVWLRRYPEAKVVTS